MKRIFVILVSLISIAAVSAQDASQSSGVRLRTKDAEKEKALGGAQITDRMRSFYGDGSNSLSEGDVQWMRVVYRQIDLNKPENAALYFPEDLVDGQENFFRILLRLVANGDVKAYEYLDGREIFTDQYRINVGDMLNRFYIPYANAKGSTEKNPKFTIDENDVPTTEVLTYYIIERWEFDNRNNRMKTYVDAVCPVIHRAGDFGGEPLRYPMFWVKFADVRPHIAQQLIFVNDDNNLPTCSYDDFFNLNMYDGEIYKTRNLRNRSLMQQFPDPDEMAQAQDSIQKRLDTFEDKLWVPNREDIIASREAREAVAAGSSIAADEIVPVQPEEKKVRSSRSSAKKKAPKVNKPKSSSSSSSAGAARSVRKRR